MNRIDIQWLRYPDTPSIVYDVPATVHHDGDRLPSRLTVARHIDGEFWEGRVFTRHDLYMTMEQVATPRNGGFEHLSHEDFLHHVCLVFGFEGGAHFDFADDDFRPHATDIRRRAE